MCEEKYVTYKDQLASRPHLMKTTDSSVLVHSPKQPHNLLIAFYYLWLGNRYCYRSSKPPPAFPVTVMYVKSSSLHQYRRGATMNKGRTKYIFLWNCSWLAQRLCSLHLPVPPRALSAGIWRAVAAKLPQQIAPGADYLRITWTRNK